MTDTPNHSVQINYHRVKDQQKAETLAQRFQRQGYPAVTALTRNDGPLQGDISAIIHLGVDSKRELTEAQADAYLYRLSSAVKVELLPLPNMDGLPLPEYETDGAAGLDLRATEAGIINPGEIKIIPTGISVAIPDGYEIQVRPRSGLAAKHGVTVLNSPGTIDSDYRGEIKAIMINHGSAAFTYARGDRIAQMVLAPVARASFIVTADLSLTSRGDGHFGSTGK